MVLLTSVMKYPLSGGHRNLWAVALNCDHISFFAAVYMKYVDVIGEMGPS